MPLLDPPTIKVMTERSEDDPDRFRWALVRSDSPTAHSRSSISYPTEEAARSEGEALARVLNKAVEEAAGYKGRPTRRAPRRPSK